MASKKQDVGVISAGSLYTLEQFRRNLKLTVSAWTALRKKGLPVIVSGKRVFVSGAQAIEFFEGKQ